MQPEYSTALISDVRLQEDWPSHLHMYSSCLLKTAIVLPTCNCHSISCVSEVERPERKLSNLTSRCNLLEGFFQDFTSSNSRGKSVTQFMWCRAGHIASSQHVKVILKVREYCYFLPYHTYSSKLCAATIM